MGSCVQFLDACGIETKNPTVFRPDFFARRQDYDGLYKYLGKGRQRTLTFYNSVGVLFAPPHPSGAGKYRTEKRRRTSQHFPESRKRNGVIINLQGYAEGKAQERFFRSFFPRTRIVLRKYDFLRTKQKKIHFGRKNAKGYRIFQK